MSSKYWLENLMERNQFGRLANNTNIEEEWAFRIGFIWLRIGMVSGFCERSNKSLGFIKCVELSDYLRDY
jgi:hypothetical protein